jgi:hypothetical protein
MTGRKYPDTYNDLSAQLRKRFSYNAGKSLDKIVSRAENSITAAYRGARGLDKALALDDLAWYLAVGLRRIVKKDSSKAKHNYHWLYRHYGEAVDAGIRTTLSGVSFDSDLADDGSYMRIIVEGQTNVFNDFLAQYRTAVTHGLIPATDKRPAPDDRSYSTSFGYHKIILDLYLDKDSGIFVDRNDDAEEEGNGLTLI